MVPRNPPKNNTKSGELIDSMGALSHWKERIRFKSPRNSDCASLLPPPLHALTSNNPTSPPPNPDKPNPTKIPPQAGSAYSIRDYSGHARDGTELKRINHMLLY